LVGRPRRGHHAGGPGQEIRVRHARPTAATQAGIPARRVAPMRVCPAQACRLRGLRWACVLATVLALCGCATRAPSPPAPDPHALRAEIQRRIPATVQDRVGWAGDIQVAFTAQRILPGVENICAVLAVIEQESGYKADPPVAGLPGIARGE